MEIQNRILKYRKLRCLTQRALAKLMDVNHSTILYWERHEMGVHKKHHEKLCKILKVSQQELFYLA